MRSTPVPNRRWMRRPTRRARGARPGSPRSSARCGVTEARHGGTELSRGDRGRHRAGDGAGPDGLLHRRGRWRRGRCLQGDGRALRALRPRTRARYAHLGTGDHRRRDGGGDDRSPAGGRDYVFRFSRDLLGHGREPGGQDALHDRRPGLAPARDPDRQRRWHAVRRAALAEPRELGHGGARPESRRALHAGRRKRPAGGGDPRPGPGPLLRAEIALRGQGPRPRRRACRPPGDGEGASEWEGLHHRGTGGNGAQGDAGRRKTRGHGHRRDRCRRPQPGAARYPDDPRGNRQDRPALYGRGEPATLRLGRRDRLDRRRRVLRRSGRPHRPHHDPARAAAGGRRAGGCGHAVGGADRGDRAKINEMTPVSELISVRHTDLYINWAWGPAADGQRIDVQDPATGEVIATVASASVQDALAAVQAAADAFRPWAAKPPRQRAEILRKGFELMIRDQERLAELMVRENGKPMVEARGEVAYAAEFFRWFRS